MKITRRDLGVILILVGILSVFLTYQMYFSSKQSEIEALQTEQKNLTKEINELQPVVDDAPFYQSEMERFVKEVSDMVQEFPVQIWYEDGILYVIEMEENLDVTIPDFTPTQSMDNLLSMVEGAGNFTGNTYSLYQASISMTYEAAGYDELKDVLNYIYDDEDNKRVITSVNFNFDETTGEISGSMNINMYAMDDGSRVYTEQKLDNSNAGVDQIFGEVLESEEAND
jgi:hypothetical protein